tara:strand:+ start:2803 stop:2994 length:192 start_codon:yes stop_codon:yes gene_type:complete
MTRKHFIQIANILNRTGGWKNKKLIKALATYFKSENDNFDVERWNNYIDNWGGKDERATTYNN